MALKWNSESGLSARHDRRKEIKYVQMKRFLCFVATYIFVLLLLCELTSDLRLSAEPRDA